MASGRTYYIDINSEFRDTALFPNPCDFAITFKTNTETGAFSYGVPLDPNNYFANTTVDPNYQGSPIIVKNGILDNLKQFNSTTTFLCGHTLPNQPVTVETPFQTIQFPLLSNSGSNGFFICKFGDATNYTFEWAVYSDSPSGTNSTTSSHFQFDFLDNVVVEFDFNAPSINLINVDVTGIKKTILSMDNPNTPIPSVVQGIFKLDQNGSLGQYNGHSWGYHIMSSNVDILPTSDNGN